MAGNISIYVFKILYRKIKMIRINNFIKTLIIILIVLNSSSAFSFFESFEDGIDGFTGSVNRNYKWIKKTMKWKSTPQDFQNGTFDGLYLKEENDFLDNYVTYSIEGNCNYYSDLTDLKFYNNELFEIIQYNRCSLEDLRTGDYTRSPSNRIPRSQKLLKRINRKLKDSRQDISDTEIIWENDNVKVKLCDYSYDDRFSSMIIINYKPIKNIFDREYNQRIAEAKRKEELEAEKQLIRKNVELEKQKEFEQKLRAKVKQESIKVKGLYLGMYYKDAISIIEDIFGEKVNINKIKSDNNKIESYNANITDASISYNTNGYVTHFAITNTDKFFNMQGIETKEFMKRFCNVFKIPNMKYSYDKNLMGSSTGYTYDSPDGYRIEIADTFIYEGQILKNLNHLIFSKTEEKKYGDLN